ncbi:MAG TPA: MmpS family transport accessory protein [Mycobacterium sp.]|nr:MmpS family transport accessory protein [Mycobacterium sp.]
MGTTLPPLDRVRDYPGRETGYETDYDFGTEADDTEEIYRAGSDGDYSWTGWPADFRVRPLTAILAAVVALGAIATAVVLNSGDSASTYATVGPAPQTLTSAPRTTSPPSAPPSQSALPRETVTTVTTPRAAPTLMPTTAPTTAPTVAPTAAPPPIALNPRTVVYSVTGTKQLLDLVNIVYTDAQGYPQTEFNVSLPWSKVVVLNPGVQTESVVATSIYGRLNCSIVNAEGQAVAVSASNTIMATCTR